MIQCRCVSKFDVERLAEANTLFIQYRRAIINIGHRRRRGTTRRAEACLRGDLLAARRTKHGAQILSSSAQPATTARFALTLTLRTPTKRARPAPRSHTQAPR